MFVEVCQNSRFVHVSKLHQHCSRGVVFFTNSNVAGCTKKPTVQMVIKTTARCFGLRFSSVVGAIQGRGGVPAVCLSVTEREAGHRAARVRDEVPGPHVRGEPVDPGPLPGASLRRSPARTKINSPYSVRRCAVQFRRRKINSPYSVRC